MTDREYRVEPDPEDAVIVYRCHDLQLQWRFADESDLSWDQVGERPRRDLHTPERAALWLDLFLHPLIDSPRGD